MITFIVSTFNTVFPQIIGSSMCAYLSLCGLHNAIQNSKKKDFLVHGNGKIFRFLLHKIELLSPFLLGYCTMPGCDFSS